MVFRFCGDVNNRSYEMIEKCGKERGSTGRLESFWFSFVIFGFLLFPDAVLLTGVCHYCQQVCFFFFFCCCFCS